MTAMDERRLSELFAEAADDAQRTAPPPRFEYADVVSDTGRPKSRARTWQTSIAAAVVLITIGAGMTAIQMLGANRSGSTLAAPGPPPTTAAAPGNRPPSAFAERTAPAPDAPLAPDARSATPFAAPPGAEKRLATSSCARPDAPLFTAVTEAVPSARRHVPRPLADAAQCPEGGRGVEVDVDDHGARGVLRVLLAPKGSGGVDTSGRGAGPVLTASANTPGGARLIVSMTAPAGHRVPYANQLGPLANRLAKRF
jgi:hypothetical protein